MCCAVLKADLTCIALQGQQLVLGNDQVCLHTWMPLCAEESCLPVGLATSFGLSELSLLGECEVVCVRCLMHASLLLHCALSSTPAGRPLLILAIV